MNLSLMSLELAVLLLGIGILLADLWTPLPKKRSLGYVAAGGVGLILLGSFAVEAPAAQYAFGGAYVLDALALFFKRFFLAAGVIVLVMSVEFSQRLESAVSEYFGLMVLALCGMMFAASAGSFTMVFVSIELITVTFYVLTSFQRNRVQSLEAGIKYLILGGLASAFLVYGIALVYGSSGSMRFDFLASKAAEFSSKPIFLMGVLLVLVGLGFKIAAFPLQMWAPDVYQGAPAPTTAFLAVGSKAAGFVVLLRVLFTAIPEVTVDWPKLLALMSALTILYGNLCAIPQRSLKRLLGYSSIAHAGYLLLGVTAMAADVREPSAGGSAILYYLSGYLFTVLAAFAVLSVTLQKIETDDISSLAGLNRRSPLLGATMTLAMVSLAGVPPLAGFFGKFLLLRAVIERASGNSALYWLVGVALAGVVISLYYYFGVIRAIYWSKDSGDGSFIPMSKPFRAVLYGCILGMLYLGLFPGALVNSATRAVTVLKATPVIRPTVGEDHVLAKQGGAGQVADER